MKQESKSRLEALLGGRDRPATTEAARQPTSGAEVQFAVAFERVREEVLLPALREFAALLENRGQPCEVIEEPIPGRHSEMARTGLRFLPSVAWDASLGACPAVMFTPDPDGGRVVVTATGAPENEAGATPGYDLDQVTAALIEAEVLKLAERVLPSWVGRGATKGQRP